MSRDQMQDVFPIVFDFKKGEQPTAEKLSGLVKHVDGGFGRITQGVGDPWDYQAHTGSGGAFDLSLENLGQSSLARIIGPSDWLSPSASDWNQAAIGTVSLSQDRNQWTLGFPLVKVTSDINETSQVSGSVTPLAWGSEILVTQDTGSVLNNRVASPYLVVSDGDFYVDFYKGTITSYKVPTNTIKLAFVGIHMFGPGVPWGTHNVIPTWEQSVLCNVTKTHDAGSNSYYTLTLPTFSNQTRYSHLPSFGQSTFGSGAGSDTSWTLVPGSLSTYRLPAALTGASLSAGDTVPEGYCLLWQGDADGRVIPQVEFQYLSATTMTLVTPIDWLNEGDNYRLIISGTSAAEAINYLFQISRNNEHVGLTDNPTVGYTIPLSHDNLQDRYTSNINSALTDVDRWKFRESDYGTNCHPQYIHRGGYMTDDADGNSANAMRGALAMAGDIDANFYLGTALYMGGLYKTAALSFGGGSVDERDQYSNAMIRLDGTFITTTYDSWSSGIAKRTPFSLNGTGAESDVGYDYVALGALSVYPSLCAPLYLRGHYPGGSYDETKNGAVLGFDLGQRNEANYVRLMESTRSGLNDAIHQPANTGQSSTSALSIMPGLSAVSGFKRISDEQVREFRFRGVPYVSSATNTTDALGGATIRGAGSNIPEFEHHFTSPSILGADFLNVYSNAIFFSDTGDGKTTSFTDNGTGWLNGNSGVGTGYTHTPSGLYYIPDTATVNGYLSFYQWDTAIGNATNCFSVGHDHGMYYQGANTQLIQGSTPTNRLAHKVLLDLTTSKCSLWSLGSSSSSLYIGTSDTDDTTGWLANMANIAAGNSVNVLSHGGGISLSAMTETGGSSRDIYIRTFHANAADTSGNVNISSEDSDVIVNAGDAIAMTSTTTMAIGAGTTTNIYGNGNISLTSGSGADILFDSGEDIVSTPVGEFRVGDSALSGSNTTTSINLYARTGANILTGHSAISSADITISGYGDILLYSRHSSNDIEARSYHDVILSPSYTDVTGAGGDLIFNNLVVGTASATLTIAASGEVRRTSSSRITKQNISSLENADWIYDLNPVSFEFKNDPSQPHYGFIADEVHRANPIAAYMPAEEKDQNVFYNSIFSALVKAVQDQKKEIEDLKSQLESK